jgi:3-hydroxyisobutyrate dehydrogenase-like beta-hydroxyacid dehydrogenase
MTNLTIGVLHPGEMGGSVGASARANAARVLWASEDRSAQTAERAAAAGLEDAKTLASLVAASDVILSVCPPHSALDLARSVAAHGFSGVYVDANAVAPGTAREIGRIVEKGGEKGGGKGGEKGGATFVDGGIIGPPARARGTTRLYLSGEQAGHIVGLFEQGPLEAIVVEGGPGAASALKMAYAAYTKGTSALLVSIRALAMHEGVDSALLAEWARSQGDLGARSERAAGETARKAWRFAGEMAEIAATFDDAGLPDGFFLAAGKIYESLAGYKDASGMPSAAEVAKSLMKQRPEKFTR